MTNFNRPTILYLKLSGIDCVLRIETSNNGGSTATDNFTLSITLLSGPASLQFDFTPKGNIVYNSQGMNVLGDLSFFQGKNTMNIGVPFLHNYSVNTNGVNYWNANDEVYYFLNVICDQTEFGGYTLCNNTNPVPIVRKK